MVSRSDRSHRAWPEGRRSELGLELGLLVVLSFLWGGSFALIKIAVQSIPPLTVVAARVLVAAVVLALVARAPAMPLQALSGAFLIQGILQSALPFALISWGEQYIDSGVAGLLNSTPPLFVFLITYFITRHEPATGRKLGGVLVGATGVALIIGVDTLAGLGRQVMAQLAMVGAAASYACAAIYGRRFAPLPPLVTAASAMVATAALVVPASLIVDEPWTLRPSLEATAAVLALGLFSTALAMLIYFRLLQTLGSLGTASGGYLRAGFSVLLGVMLLGEPFTLPLALGLILIIVGVGLINGPQSCRLPGR
jgi:drug/metabolite transporter (DMT)-like permease